MREGQSFEKLQLYYHIPIKTQSDNYLRIFHEKNAEKLLANQMNDCVNYLEELCHNGVPIIFNLDHLTYLLGTDEYLHVKYKSEVISSQKKELFWMSKGGKKEKQKESKIWNQVSIRKKQGGKRILTIPNKKLKIIQRWIYENILLPYYYKNLKPEFKKDFVPKKIQKPFQEKAVHGFLPNKSIVTNAKRHVGQEVILKIDLKDFFPTISKKRVKGIFEKMGYTTYLSTVLAGLCTFNDQLPQGAPTSPMLANLISMKMDLRLYSLCKKYRFKYTRYADDIAISGRPSLIKFQNTIFRIIEKENFSISEKKLKIIGKSNRQSITGVVVNEKLNVKREEIRKMRAILHNCEKQGILADKRNRNLHFKHQLYGKISFINMIRPDLAKQFKKQADTLDWDSYDHWIIDFNKKIYSEYDTLKLDTTEIKAIINNGENKHVEFKETLKWDVNKKQPNNELVDEFSKEIVAFLNNKTTQKQFLFLGVNDNKTITGINKEIKKLYGKERNLDKYIQTISNAIMTNIGVSYLQYIDWHIKKIDEKEIIIITIKFSEHKPAFYKEKNNEKFYIRHLIGKKELKGSKMIEYKEGNW